MRHSAFFRGLAGVLSVWLAICLAEPAQLHTCAMHGALAISVHGSGSHHGSSHAAVGHSHDQSNDDGRGQQCTCLGDCTAGKIPIGVAAPSTSFASVSVEIPVLFFSYASPSIVAPHFLLPFSNGPPDASSRA